MTRPLFTPYAGGRPIRRRHLLGPEDGYPRSVCRDVGWTVKAEDDATLPWCEDCRPWALEALAVALEVLEEPRAAAVVRARDDARWEIRKALIDEAIRGDLEGPGGDLIAGIVALRAVAEAATAEAVARNRVPPRRAELETSDLEDATASAVHRYLGEAEWNRRTYHPEEITR